MHDLGEDSADIDTLNMIPFVYLFSSGARQVVCPDSDVRTASKRQGETAMISWCIPRQAIRAVTRSTP